MELRQEYGRNLPCQQTSVENKLSVEERGIRDVRNFNGTANATADAIRLCHEGN